MSKIIIEKLDKGFVVRQDNLTADWLQWDEMLALVAQITMPENKPCLHWLKTPEQMEAEKILLNNIADDNIFEDEHD